MNKPMVLPFHPLWQEKCASKFFHGCLDAAKLHARWIVTCILPSLPLRPPQQQRDWKSEMCEVPLKHWSISLVACVDLIITSCVMMLTVYIKVLLYYLLTSTIFPGNTTSFNTTCPSDHSMERSPLDHSMVRTVECDGLWDMDTWCGTHIHIHARIHVHTLTTTHMHTHTYTHRYHTVTSTAG